MDRAVSRPFGSSEVFGYDEEWKILPRCGVSHAARFWCSRRHGRLEGGTLVDFKVEFGFDSKGTCCLLMSSTTTLAGRRERSIH